MKRWEGEGRFFYHRGSTKLATISVRWWGIRLIGRDTPGWARLAHHWGVPTPTVGRQGLTIISLGGKPTVWVGGWVCPRQSSHGRFYKRSLLDEVGVIGFRRQAFLWKARKINSASYGWQQFKTLNCAISNPGNVFVYMFSYMVQIWTWNFRKKKRT